MQFMADVTVTCTDCSGRRFTPSVLAIEWEGKNIDAILNLTIEDAAQFFVSEKRIITKLQPLLDVGLGYLKLGQSTTTLSGGEAQRLKLSSYLADCVGAGSSQKALLLFDEPSTGLHLCDIERLIEVFRKLVAEGHSLVVIEHNIDVLIHADYLIDMGPAGGEAGGDVVAQGTVSEVISNPDSITGMYLSERFGRTTPV
jgi:excinuclease ABC subunit A